MIRRVIRAILRRVKLLVAGSIRDVESAKAAAVVTQREMVEHLARIPYWEYKIEFLGTYDYSGTDGAWHSKKENGQASASSGFAASTPDYDKINYGCGATIIDGWLNVDLFPSEMTGYRQINLLEKHPFPDSYFQFGFSEDVLEHLNQAESIFFLSEIYRTLVDDGILRLSFPGLEGVLDRHYTPASETVIRRGEFEAYSFWDHIHFYSREELALVTRHIGFREINFVEYGESQYPELAGMDTRDTQIGLNIYAELIK